MLIASAITILSVYFIFEQVLLRVQYYRVDVGISDVVISLAILFGLGLTTVLSQTIRAANTNPVDNLKVE